MSDVRPVAGVYIVKKKRKLSSSEGIGCKEMRKYLFIYIMGRPLVIKYDFAPDIF